MSQRRLEPYPAYKDSGVEWLGEIPAHWEESKVKFLGSYVNGFPFKPDDWSVEGLPIIRIQNLTNPEADFNRYSGKLAPRYRVTRGDILISWSASLGLFVWSEEEDGWLNQHIFKVTLHPGFVEHDFFIWLGDWFIRELKKETHGSTMTHLTNNMFGSFRVELPPLQEQRAIAAFLDRETARIDALVAKNERLIELVREKRTALITRAVTRGLDPNVPMKDSGVEWLGEIPAHWEVKPLKRGVRFLEGPGIMANEFANDGIPLLRIAGIGGRTVTLNGCNYLSLDLVRRRWEHFRVRSGDLLISGSASTGFCSEVDEETEGAVPYTGIIIIRPRPSVTEKAFLRWFFLSGPFLTQTELARTGSAIQHFGPSHLSRMHMVVPPLSEQSTIAAYLDRETARIDALVAKVREAIERLKEYRTALISAAVTGKIDVREEAA